MKMKRNFIVLGLCIYKELTSLGNEKVYHEFKKLGSFPNLDSAVSYILDCDDGRFRIVRRSGNRFLPTLSCFKLFNVVTFLSK